MDIRLAPREEWHQWDALLATVPSASPLAHSGWLCALERAYGVQTAILLASADGAICGGCACYVVRDASGAIALYSLRQGFIAPDAAIAADVVGAVTSYARRCAATRVVLSAGAPLVSVGDACTTRTTIVLPVASSDAAQWDDLRNKTRNMVRKAQRAGCTVRRGGGEDWDAFYAIYVRRMLARGVPIHRKQFFAAVRTLVPDTELLVVEREGRMIGGLLLAIGAHGAAYPYQASDAGADQYAPTPLLVWEALRRCVAQGVPLLDMGESSPGGSVYAAKVHFGGVPRPVQYLQLLGASPRSTLRATMLMRAATLGVRYAPPSIATQCGVWLKQRGRML